MKKRNGMCPFCYVRALAEAKKAKNGNEPVLYNTAPYNNAPAQTPPMGWSSWNTFQEKINQDVILQTAADMKRLGLVDAGYVYLNIDDCWEAKERNLKGELEADYTTFSMGMENLAKKVNEQGMKLGIYSSNGLLTCQDFPASLGFEYRDAYTFAKWGIEYWKLDFCHHINYTQYAPLVAGIGISEIGRAPDTIIGCKEGACSGYARIFRSGFRFKRHGHNNQTLPFHASGLDGGRGAITFTVNAEKDGDFVLTVYTHERYSYEKFLGILVNNETLLTVKIPPDIRWNEYTAQKIVQLRKGANTLKLFNPILNPATSDMLQYQYAGRCIKQATADYARDSGKRENKIMFSLCEWGAGKPYLWGASAGNLWRTTGDIEAKWKSVMHIYEQNVGLYEYAGPGGFNDPDMLEVGNGELTRDENVAHFALWCMMAAPLILGNDIRVMPQEVLDIVTNKHLIGINQDPLGKQAKRIVKGDLDVLVKPLAGGTAVCVLNKKSSRAAYSIDEKVLSGEKYIRYEPKEPVLDALTGIRTDKKTALSGELAPHSVKVFIV